MEGDSSIFISFLVAEFDQRDKFIKHTLGARKSLEIAVRDAKRDAPIVGPIITYQRANYLLSGFSCVPRFCDVFELCLSSQPARKMLSLRKASKRASERPTKCKHARIRLRVKRVLISF
jgi:hypothetical protein